MPIPCAPSTQEMRPSVLQTLMISAKGNTTPGMEETTSITARRGRLPAARLAAMADWKAAMTEESSAG